MVEEILKEMIIYANGNKKDIAHFLKAHSYARLTGKLEQLDEKTQKILEIAAIVHDIACPLCRKKYGNSNGKFQEIEGPDLVYDFLKPFSLTDLEINRIAYLVGHHHTYENIDGLDYQILLEADFLVNGDEMNADNKTIAAMKNKVFKTAAGIKLLEYIYE